MNGHTPKEVILGEAAVSIGASQTNAPISKEFAVSEGGSLNFRADLYFGKVATAGTITVKLQDSSGYNLWADNKTATASASTDKTVVSVDSSADSLEVTGHGYTDATAVVVNSSGQVPAGLVAGVVYYSKAVDANNIELHRTKALGSKLDITDAGSGTITVTAVSKSEITVVAEVAGDATYLPINAQGRLVATTAGGESLQVVSIKVVQEN